MRILFIGDIVGKPGRELLRKGLRPLIDHHGVEFVIANVENAAAGAGNPAASDSTAQRTAARRVPDEEK